MSKVRGIARTKDAAKKKLSDMSDDEIVAEVREFFIGNYERSNPGAEAVKGTSLWSALHGAAIVSGSILIGIKQVDPKMAEAIREARLRLTEEDPEPPTTPEERAAVDRGGMVPRDPEGAS